MSTFKTELTKWLSGNRNGVELAKALVEVLVKYLVDVVGVEDVKEVQIKSLVATAKEAWEHGKGGEFPAMHADAISRWSAGRRPHPRWTTRWNLASRLPSLVSRAKVMPTLSPRMRRSSSAMPAAPTMRERDQMQSDKAKQGLSGLRT